MKLALHCLPAFRSAILRAVHYFGGDFVARKKKHSPKKNDAPRTKLIPANAFKKGHKKVGGRQKGTKNKITNDLRQAIINALDTAGGEKWFVALAKSDKKSFAQLVGRCVPTRHVGDDDGPIKIMHMTDKLEGMTDAQLEELKRKVQQMGLG